MKRKLKEIDGVPHLKCKGELHKKGKWVPVSKFYRQWNKGQQKYYYRSVCKSCLSFRHSRYRSLNPHEFTQHGYIPVADIRPWLEQIIKDCDGIRPAARLMGVHNSTVLLWLGKTKKSDGKYLRYIQRNSAAKVLRTLQEIRNGTKKGKRLKPGPKKKGATLVPGEEHVR